MKSRKRLDVIVAGDACVDLLLDDVPPLELGKEKLASNARLVLGGSSSITAFNLARLGARVGFAGLVGRDTFGDFVRERLQWAGVDVKRLLTAKDVPTGITVWCNRGEKRAGVTYLGTIALLKGRGIASDYLESARHLHVGAYFLLSGLHRDAAALFRRARRLGLTTSVDTNWDPAEEWDSRIREVLQETDVFFPNDDEALRLTGAASVEIAAEQLGRMARVVAVKRGSRGVLVRTRLGRFFVASPKVRAVDTTCAGDSFNAGFLAAYLRGESLESCAEAGVQAGAKAVTKSGGTGAFEGDHD